MSHALECDLDDDCTCVDAAIEQLREEMNRLRGRLFQSIEAAGLPEKQESALKGLVRHTTYDAQANVEAALRGADANHR